MLPEVIALAGCGNRPDMNALRSLVVVGVALFGAACGGIAGSGTSKTEVRQVAGFHRVEVSGALEVTLTDRDPATVSVSADDNLLEHISTEVADGVLKVQPKNGASLLCRAPLAIEVSWRTLHEAGASGASKLTSSGGILCDRVAIAASGASLIDLQSLKGNEVVVWASGASKVSVGDVQALRGSFQVSGASEIAVQTGKLVDLELDVSGASKLSLGALAAESAVVAASGASDVAFSASQSVNGMASGASRVSVKGAPAQRGLQSSGGSAVQFE